MKTLSKYALREHLLPLVGGFAVIMFVLVMDFVLDMLNLIITKGVEPYFVLKLFALNLAWMLALAVPMACLIAGLMAFGRLSEDGEINAAVGSGIPFVRLMAAPLFASLILSLGMVYFSDQILPDLNFESKMLLGDIKRKKPTLAIKEQVFINDFPGIGMLIEEVDERTNSLSGITIYDQKDRRYPRVITAKRGKMSFDAVSDALDLELFDGTIHEIDDEDASKYTLVKFERQTIRFADLGLKLERREGGNRGDREMKIADMRLVVEEKELAIAQSEQMIRNIADRAIRRAFVPPEFPAKDSLEALRSLKALAKSTSQSISSQLNAISAHQRYIRKYQVEIHKKWSLPFACLFFLLVGAPVGVWARKGGFGVAIGLGVCFFIIYWTFLIGGEELGDRGFLAPWLSMWISNIALGVFGAAILYRTIWSSRFKGFGFVAKFINWVKKTASRRRIL